MQSFNTVLWENLFKKFTQLLGVISLGFTIVILIWSTNKSFDFTDESFYSIGYYFNIELDNTIIFFHKIYNYIFGFLNLTLAQNRLLSILLIMGSSLILTYNSILYFKLRNKLLIILTVTIIGFLGYFIYPMSVSYNTIASILATLLISTSLNYLHRRKKPTLIVIGILSALILLNKFTNILFLFLFAIGTIGLSFQNNKVTIKQLIINIALTTLGFFFAFLLLFFSVESLTEQVNEFFYGLTLSSSHSLEEMVSRFLNELLRLISFFIYLLPLLILLIVIAKSKIQFLKTNQVLFILTAIIITFLYLEYSTYFFFGSYNVSVFYFLIILTAVFLLFFYRNKVKNNKQLVFGIIFIAIPFLISLGTNNSLFIHFTFNGSIFGLGIYLIINKIPNKIIKYTLFSFVFFTTSFIITYGKYYYPYRSEKLSLQTETIVGVPYLKEVKTTPDIIKTINELKEFKKHSSKRVFLCSHQLGVSLVINKQPLFFSWIDESNYHLISDYLENKKEELSQSILFFIPSEIEKKEAIISELSTSEKLGFLNDYHYYKTITINNNALDIYKKEN